MVWKRSEQMGMTSSIQSWLWAGSLTVMIFATWVAGDPVLGPDLNSCHPIIPEGHSKEYTCCILDRPIVDFKFPNGPMRVRQALHKLNVSSIAKYERANAIMRSLPASDPRSHQAQADLHCAYTTSTYNQFNSTTPLSAHGSWLTLASHRWYVYFHERILGSLIGDDSFALPYWAWDIQYDPSANIIPYFYENANSSLYDEFRSYLHMPPVTVDIETPDHLRQSYFTEKDPSDKVRINLDIMWKVMIGSAKTKESFLGGSYVKGSEKGVEVGLLEAGPHSAVHIWTGAQNKSEGEDMRPVYSGGRDPLFFNHHSQVDRLWQIYLDMGGINHDDPDYLDTELLFYDENKDLVRVRMGDVLDLEKLRISFEMIEPVDWMEYVPVSARKTDLPFESSLLRRSEVESPLISEDSPLQLQSSEVDVFTTRVQRPLRGRNGEAVLVRDEALVLEGTVTKPWDMSVAIHVFINLPEADKLTRKDCLESLGSVYLDGDGGRRITDPKVNTRKFSRKIGIGSRYRLLEIQDSASVTITLVPAWEKDLAVSFSVNFTHVSLKLQLDESSSRLSRDRFL